MDEMASTPSQVNNIENASIKKQNVQEKGT